MKVVGVGEGVGDLIEFDPDEFAAALFGGDSLTGGSGRSALSAVA